MDVRTNQPLEWGEIINLPEDQLRTTLSANQQQACHRVISLLYQNITSETKPLKELVSKIVRCLPEEAAQDSSLPKILDYMNENGNFYTGGTIWNLYQNVPDPQLITKIKESIANGNGGFALELLNHGFPLAESDVKECLLLASSKGEMALVLKLLELGTERIIQGKKEWQMFTMMPQFDTDEVIKMDSNIKDSNGNTPLELAILNGHPDTAAILLEYSIPLPEETLQKLLCLASAKGQTAIMARILDLGEAINAEEGERLQSFLVASEEPIGVNTKGLKFSADAPDEQGSTPLHHACENGHREAALMLIKSGVDINARDDNRNTPLMLASRHNHTGIALHLIRNGASVNARNHEGETAVANALRNENKAIVCKLIEKGAQIDLTNPPEFLRGALKESMLSGNTTLALGLLKNGFPAEENMLFWACQEGMEKVALELTKHGNSNFTDAHNNTPLHMACEKNLVSVVARLIEQGANYAAVNDNGDSPMRIAIRNAHEGLEAVFIANKIDINSIKLDEELKRITALDEGFGRRIANAKDSVEAKVIFSLAKLLKEIKQNNSKLPKSMQIDLKTFVAGLKNEPGKNFFSELEREMHALHKEMQKRQFANFHAIARQVGGEQFENDFEEFYIREAAFNDFANGSKSVLEHPFFMASPEEKMKMVFQSAACAKGRLSQEQFDILFSKLETMYKDSGMRFEAFYQRIELLLRAAVDIHNAQDNKKAADLVIGQLFPQLLQKIDTDPSRWIEPLKELMELAGEINTGQKEFAAEVIADAVIQFAMDRGFPKDAEKFRAAATDSRAAAYLELLCEKRASDEKYTEVNKRLWMARISEKLDGRDLQQHLFDRYFSGAFESKKCTDICDGLASCHELAKRFNAPLNAVISGYLRYIDDARSYAFPGSKAILAYAAEKLPAVTQWQTLLTQELPRDSGAKLFLDLLVESGFYPITEAEIKTVGSLYKKGLESLKSNKLYTEAANRALAEGCVAFLNAQRMTFKPLEVPTSSVIHSLYYLKVPAMDGWEQKIESSLLLQQLRAHNVRGPVSKEEVDVLNKLCREIKTYPEDVAVIAVRRYVQSCHAKSTPFKGAVSKKLMHAFCFEAVVEKALGSEPKERKEAAIKLLGAMNGRGTPLTKEGQRRLTYLARKIALHQFAGGRPLTHPRIEAKFPDLLAAIGLSHVTNLNGFVFDELLGEMFDEEQAYIFKNINVKELIDATISHPEEAIISVATPAISALLGGKELDDDTKKCIQDLAKGLQGVLYDKMQNLKGKVDETRAVEFDIEVSTKEILSGVLEGVVAARNAHRKEEKPSFVQKLIRSAADYLFSGSKDASGERVAELERGAETNKTTEGWGQWTAKTLMRGVGSAAGSYLISKAANVAIPYLINQEITECEHQIENAESAEALKLLQLQLDLLKCLRDMSPQLSALAVKVVSNLLDTIDQSKTSALIYDWMTYDDEKSIKSRVSNSNEVRIHKNMAKEKIVDMLYTSAMTALTEGQDIFSGLFEGVLSGIKTIPSLEMGERDNRVPMPPINEPVQKEALVRLVEINKERFVSIAKKEITPLYWSSDKDKIVVNQLFPQLVKEFEGIFARDPALEESEIKEVCKLMDVGYGLLEKGYTAREIAIGCRRCCEEQMRSSKSVKAVDQKKLLPFVFDGVVESLAEEVLHSGKTRMTPDSVETEAYLKEKVLFHLNHTKIGSPDRLLNSDGRAALKEMITTLFQPQFCEGKLLLHPLVLERFPLILQGAHLSDVNLLNAQDAEKRAVIRKNMIMESELCLKKINIGKLKNAITNQPQACMTSVANAAVNVLTKGIDFKDKQKDKEITKQLIATFINTSLIQDFLTKAKFELDSFSFQGVDIEASISLEPLANELKKTTEKLLHKIETGELPPSEMSGDSMLLAPMLRQLVENFDKAQSSRSSMIKGDTLEPGSAVHEIVKLLKEFRGDALGVQGKAIAMAMGLVLKFPETASEAFKSPELMKPLSSMIKPIVVATAFGPHEKVIRTLTAKKEKEGLTAEEQVKLTLTQKVLDNKKDFVDLMSDMVLATLLQMDDIQDIVRLFQYIAELAGNQSMKVDKLHLSELMVKSFDVILSNISVFHEVIPTLLGSIASSQKYA